MPTRTKSTEADVIVNLDKLADSLDGVSALSESLDGLSASLDGVSSLNENLDSLQANIGQLADAQLLAAIAQFGDAKDRKWAVGEMKWKYETQFGDVLIPRPAKPPGLKYKS